MPLAHSDNPALFSPQEASRHELALAVLMDRLSNLPKESLADLAALGHELAQCQDAETFHEIAETMREIIFPEIVGRLNVGSAGTAAPSENLQKWATSVGGRIRDRRTAAGMTQIELAERCGLPQSHISRLESGRHSPSHRTLERIARALGVSVAELDPPDP